MARIIRAAVTGLGLAMLLSTAATASIYTVTFTGKLKTLTDYDGVFGTAPGGLIGAPVRTVVRIDDAVPGATINEMPGTYGVSGPSVASATLTVNGISYAFSGLSSGALNRVNLRTPSYPSYDGIFTNAMGSAAPGAYTAIQVYAQSASDDFLENTPFGDFYGSPLRFTVPKDALSFSAGSFDIQYGFADRAYGDFSTDRVVVTAGSVPEPCAWSMMVAGFGAMGAMLRRRAGKASRGTISPV